MHSIRIDRGKRLAHEPGCGHNRFHPDIAPIVEVGEGEEVALETRDALDGQLKPGTRVADFPALDAGAVHPLTGPVFVKGAVPGDMLEIEFTDIIAQPFAFSAIIPGLGFLRDVMGRLGPDAATLVAWAEQATATDYASLAPLALNSAEADDPFASFSEWASEADEKSYQDL